VAVGIWPLSPAIKEIGVWVTVGAWLASHLVARKRPMRLAIMLPFLLWFGAGALSMVHSVSLRASVMGLVKILKAMGIVFATAHVVRTKRRMTALLSAALIGAALASLDGFWQLLHGADALYQRPPGTAVGHLLRLTAAFGHANDFGVYAISVLPVGIALARGMTDRGRRVLAWTAVALLAVALPLTLSRGAALGITVALLVWCFVRRAWRTLAACCGVVVVGLVCLPAPLRHWAVNQGSWFNALVLPERPQIWQATINMITAHPIIGVGINTFVLNYSRYKSSTDVIHSAYAHNHYLHLTAELGLLGLAAFLWFLASTARVWWRLLASHDSWIQLMAAGLGCGAIAFLVIGLLESALYSSHTNLGFWLWVGLLHGFGARQPVSHNTA